MAGNLLSTQPYFCDTYAMFQEQCNSFDFFSCILLHPLVQQKILLISCGHLSMLKSWLKTHESPWPFLRSVEVKPDVWPAEKSPGPEPLFLTQEPLVWWIYQHCLLAINTKIIFHLQTPVPILKLPVSWLNPISVA